MKDDRTITGSVRGSVQPTLDVLSEVSNLLRMDVGEPRLTQMIDVMSSAAQMQFAINDSISKLAPLKEDLDSISSSLGRIDRTLERMHLNDEQLLDQYYYYVNGRDQLLMRESAFGSSGIAVMVKRLENAVDYYRSTLASPGKGKKKLTNHNEALTQIADAFTALFPQYELSAAGSDSVFPNLIRIWFNGFMGDQRLGDPKSRIQNMLEYRATLSE